MEHENKCIRWSDGSVIYWDEEKQAIVIVRNGKIETYFKPDIGREYFRQECERV